MNIIKAFNELFAAQDKGMSYVLTTTIPADTEDQEGYWDRMKYFKRYVAARTQARMAELMYGREKARAEALEQRVEEQYIQISSYKEGSDEYRLLVRQNNGHLNTIHQLRKQLALEREQKEAYKLRLDMFINLASPSNTNE